MDPICQFSLKSHWSYHVKNVFFSSILNWSVDIPSSQRMPRIKKYDMVNQIKDSLRLKLFLICLIKKFLSAFAASYSYKMDKLLETFLLLFTSLKDFDFTIITSENIPIYKMLQILKETK